MRPQIDFKEGENIWATLQIRDFAILFLMEFLDSSADVNKKCSKFCVKNSLVFPMILWQLKAFDLKAHQEFRDSKT